MKKITILFGEMGGGKNYWGEKIARERQCTFFDGDTAATPEMLARVIKFKPLTREMVIGFVNRLAEIIAVQTELSNGLVVAQALYFREDRQFLKWFLTALGHDVQFIWIKSPFFRNLKQIYSRPNGLRWVIYWLMNKPWFQKPDDNCEIIS